MQVTTDTNGTKIGEQGHYPFGENWYSSSTTTKFRFTSYERDAESLNDYAIFRTHINRLGRFNRPDPVAGSIADPQSLNRFAYVRNDPVNLVDPLGLCWNIWIVTFEVDTGRIRRVEHFGTIGCESLGGGPNVEEEAEDYVVDQDVLEKCVDEIFGVELRSFSESRKGQHGVFVGYGPNEFLPGENKGNNSEFTVRNNNTLMSERTMTILRGRNIKEERVLGFTIPAHPWRNFTANDLSPRQTILTQLHELAHSLARITGVADPGKTDANKKEYLPERLIECVEDDFGIRKRGEKRPEPA